MALSVGARIGTYEILAPLGAGGMGEVYRARDTRLQRDIALKVLPEGFARDPDRMARFQREAKLLASLNHPNIASIYGVEECALAMELVEGKMLSGPLPIDTILHYARQMAEALEYAHERGVIHRDLKPANVKVTPEGVVKLLDFGLAKGVEDPSTPDDPANSPTLTLGATRAGVILGTAAYMAPEQASGKVADRRADIWSFGAVVYEMLSGKRAFEGESAADTLASVIKLDPDWSQLPTETPAALRKLIRRCLTKDRKQRLQAIGEARIAIEDIHGGAPVEEKASSATAPPLSRLGIAGWVAATMIACVALWGWLRPTPPQPRPVTHFTTALSSGPPLSRIGIAMSRDGSRLAFTKTTSGPIYLRIMDQPEAKPIPGTENAYFPAFSPDGQWIAFFTSAGSGSRQLKKMLSTGGGALTLTSTGADAPPWLSWGEDGNILYSTNDEGLLRIPSAGGKPQILATPDVRSGEQYYAAPQLLPGGKEVLFSIGTNAQRNDERIAVLNLQSGEKKTLLEGAGIGWYLPSERGSASGHIVYARAGSLFAAPFDVKRLRAGSPAPVLEGVRTIGSATYGLSDAGTLAYVPGGVGSETQSTMVWIDRQGVEQSLPVPPRNYGYLRISPDGERVVVGILSSAFVGHQSIWVYDLVRGSLTPIAREKNNSAPVWTPDGKRLLYLSSETPSGRAAPPATGALVSVPSDGGGPPSILASEGPSHLPSSVSPDGKLAIGTRNKGGGARGGPPNEMWVMALAEGASRGAKPQSFRESQFTMSGGQFSPDGRWVAYQSNESGDNEIYVVPYPGPGGRTQVSTDGGTIARWSRNGRELFYRSRGRMMAVDIQTSPVFRAGKPRMLFQRAGGQNQIYDVAPDGRRFLMTTRGGASAQERPEELHVVVNWVEELRRRVPGKIGVEG